MRQDPLGNQGGARRGIGFGGLRLWVLLAFAAYAGYYCLYAYDGYVYHYPFDDRPSAYRWRRHRF